jgi:hypothetical protein
MACQQEPSELHSPAACDYLNNDLMELSAADDEEQAMIEEQCQELELEEFLGFLALHDHELGQRTYDWRCAHCRYCAVLLAKPADWVPKIICLHLLLLQARVQVQTTVSVRSLGQLINQAFQPHTALAQKALNLDLIDVHQVVVVR